MIDTLPLGEIGGQHAPLDPPFGHIKDGIEYGPHTQGARSSTAFGGGDQIFDPLPFLVGQVAWIYFFVHLPILHNPRRLFRQAHRSEEFEERMPSWKKQGLIIKYLPPYSPELNLIEILWERIKYTWLPFSAYQCLNALIEALENILSNVGSKYQITFA